MGMRITRRDLLSAAATAGALMAGAAPARAAQGRWTAPSLPAGARVLPFALTRDGFLQHINQIFQVLAHDGQVHALTLAMVQDGAAAWAARTIGSQYCFTALFVGAAWHALGEGTFDVVTPGGSRLQLYLKPGVVANGWRFHEAPFNGLTIPDLDRTFGRSPL